MAAAGSPAPHLNLRWFFFKSLSQRFAMIKNPPANAGDVGSIPGSGRSPAGGNNKPLQYSCLEIPMDRGAWQAACSSWGCKESDTIEHSTKIYVQTG